MSDTSTTRMLDLYMDEATSPMFLSSFFQSPPSNFHDSQKVEVDIIRNQPDVAVPLPSLNSGSRKVEATEYLNKAYTPPVYSLETPLSAYDGLKRRPGMDPFTDPDFATAAATEAFSHMRMLEGMIRRGVELQCAQVLQDCALSLVDEDGNVIYDLAFDHNNNHFVNAGTTWAADGSSGNPLNDLGDLAETIRKNGKSDPGVLIMGKEALRRFYLNDNVTAQLDTRRINIGDLAPRNMGAGATFHGMVWVGHYEFEIWSYKSFYVHPQTGVNTPFVEDNNVIMLSRDGRLDLTFGSIPTLAPPDARAARFLPPRFSSSDRGLDISVNAWLTPNGKHLMLEAGTRPLAIPTAVDTFGRLDIEAA